MWPLAITSPGCQQLQHGHPQVGQMSSCRTCSPALHALPVPVLRCLTVKEVGPQQLPDASIAQLRVELSVQEDVIGGHLAQQRLQGAVTFSAFWSLGLGRHIPQECLQSTPVVLMLLGRPEK